MLRRLLLLPLQNRSIPSITTKPLKTLTLITHPFSTNPNNNKNNTKTRNKKKRYPELPPFTEYELDAAISSLPSRFTSSDLTSLLHRLPNPQLCHRLILWASDNPRFRLRPDPSPFLVAARKLGAARLLPELRDLASLALSLPLPPSLPLSNTLIYFLSQSPRCLSLALFIYRRLRDSPEPSSPGPDLQTYNLLFAALLSRVPNSLISHAYMPTLRSLFRQMLASNIAPDTQTLNFLIRGYVQSLHLNDALRVFHQFGPVYGCEPDEVTYSYLVHGLCAQGRTRNAMEMYEDIRGKGMRVSERAGNSLVSALAMEGEVEEAVRVLWEVVGGGVGLEGITLRTVLDAVCGSGRVEEALGLVRELRDREVVDGRVYRELLNGIEDGFGGVEVG